MSDRYFEENELGDSILDGSVSQNSEYVAQYNYCAISGKVIDKDNGLPLSGVNVRISVSKEDNIRDDYATTDANGFFEFPYSYVKDIVDGTLYSEEFKYGGGNGIPYRKSKEANFSATNRTNIILEVSQKLDNGGDDTQYAALQNKYELIIKIHKETLSSSFINSINLGNVKDKFTLTFKKKSDDFADAGWYTDGNALTSMREELFNTNGNFITIGFQRRDDDRTPRCYSIGTLSITGDDSYYPSTFQVSTIILSDPTTRSQTIELYLRKKAEVINDISNTSLTLNVYDEENHLITTGKPVTNLRIYHNAEKILEKTFSESQTDGNGKFPYYSGLPTVDILGMPIEYKLYDLITIEADGFYASSFMITSTGYQTYVVNMIYGNELNGSSVTNDEDWHQWETAGFPWYEKKINIKYEVKDINSGDKRQFTESNVSIYNLRNTKRAIDGVNTSRHPIIENKINIGLNDCNEIIIVRNKTINGKQYVFNLPYYQECYPSQMITKKDTSNNIEIHRYASTGIKLQYRTKDLQANQDIYASGINGDIRITYNKGASEVSCSFDGNSIVDDDHNIHIWSDTAAQNNVISANLKGNVGNMDLANVFIEPAIANSSASIRSNIDLLSAIYSNVKCFDENFILTKVDPEQVMEYIYGYVYSESGAYELPIGEYSCDFYQNGNRYSNNLTANNNLAYNPEVNFTAVVVNNSNIEIKGIKPNNTSISLINDTNNVINNSFIDTSNTTQSFIVSYSYDTNVKNIEVSYKVVSNPECVVNNLSFSVNDNFTYSVQFTGNTYTSNYFSEKTDNGTISNGDIFLITTKNAEQELSNNANITKPSTYTKIYRDDNGIALYGNHTFAPSSSRNLLYSINMNDWIFKDNDVSINGYNDNNGTVTTNNVVAYVESTSSEKSTYEATYIAYVIDNENLGYIYNTSQSNTIYTSQEIDKESKVKYYLIHNSGTGSLSNVQYFNTGLPLTSTGNVNSTYTDNTSDLLSSIYRNKFIDVTTTSGEGLYADLLEIKHESDSSYIYSTCNTLYVYDNDGNDYCTVSRFKHLIESKCGHSWICDTGVNNYYNSLLEADFQQNFGITFNLISSKYYLTTNNTPSVVDNFESNYKSYIRSKYESLKNVTDHSYDYNPTITSFQYLIQCVNIYANAYEDPNINFDQDNSALFQNISLDSNWYYNYVYKYEKNRPLSGSDILYSYYCGPDISHDSVAWPSSGTKTLKEYFGSFADDDTYNESLDYLKTQCYSYGIIYTYVHNITNIIDNFYNINDKEYYKLVPTVNHQSINVSNTNITYIDGNDVHQEILQASFGGTLNDSFIQDKLRFIVDYTNGIVNIYNNYINKNNIALSESDVINLFNGTAQSAGYPTIVNTDSKNTIYGKYNAIYEKFNANNLSLKNINYSSIVSNIYNETRALRLFNTMCESVFLLEKNSENNVVNISLPQTYEYDYQYWANVIDILKYFKANTASKTSYTDHENYWSLEINNFTNDLISSGSTMIYIKQSIFNEYYNSDISAIIDSLSEATIDNSLKDQIYDPYIATINNMQNKFDSIKYITPLLLKDIKSNCEVVLNEFANFRTAILTSELFQSFNDNLNQIIQSLYSNPDESIFDKDKVNTLIITNIDSLVNLTCSTLNRGLNLLTSYGYKILIMKYIIRAYNYSFIQNSNNEAYASVVSEQISVITNDAINTEIKVVKDELKNIIENLKDNNVKLRKTPSSSTYIATFDDFNIHSVIFKRKYCNNRTIIYFTNIDFLPVKNDNTNAGADGLYIKYLIHPRYDITIDKIISENIPLNTFNGTIFIDNEYQEARYLYMYIFFNDVLYKQLDIIDGDLTNGSAASCQPIKYNGSILHDVISSDRIEYTLSTTDNNLSISFSNQGITFGDNNYYIELESKKYNDTTWYKESKKIVSQTNNYIFTKIVEYDRRTFANNVYIFRYRLKNDWLCSNYKYFIVVAKSNDSIIYTKSPITSSNISIIGIDGKIYLRTNENNGNYFWWVAEVNNSNNGATKFKMISNVSEDGQSTNIARQCTPNIATKYYNDVSWRKLSFDNSSEKYVLGRA